MQNMNGRAAQIAVVNELREYDHAFISADGVRHFTEPFGFVGRTFTGTNTLSPENPKGLQLHEGVDEMEGADAADVAVEICRKLGVPYPPMHGRGSRLRVCCDALIRHLES